MSDVTAAVRRTAAPRWSLVSALVLCVVGLGISIYLAIEHATAGTSLACPATGRIDCVKVTTSSYSEIFGIPVAYLGVAYFVVATALAFLALSSTAGSLALARVVVAVAGILFVLYLVWAELFRIHAICLWCTGVHVVTFLVFAVTVLGEALRDPDAVD
ncbi:MAG: vitamin K epoxide reductase family protein [Nocardioidaceae bacterium]|nr:vitamin K epoxide reductase family protein [Nocardioidaceae bacterium]MCL2613986.1 vitamin K epoxide reductase family protein [Nocardioidaceae bacterium]